jgi:hypothetical protein
MSYVRLKKINKDNYAYLVESIKTSQGPRQKVKQYLGRVYDYNSLNKPVIVVNGTSAKEILLSLIIPELISRGFKKVKESYVKDKIIFSNLKFNKNIVLKINKGYLCNYFIEQILNFDKRKSARDLAKLFLSTGLEIDKESFVTFYQKL